MADELGQPAPVEGTPAPETKPAETAPVIGGKFAGKTVEDVANAYEALEKKLGEQGQQLGQLRGENQQLTTFLQQVANQAQQQQRPPAPVPEPKWDWEKPDEAAAQIADKRVDRKLGEFYRTIRTQQAQTNMQYAKNMAKQQHPELFSGEAEGKVDSFMQNALRSGSVDPALVENPQMWTSMAYVMHGIDRNFSLGGAVSPTSPTFTEQPAGARPRRDESDEEPVVMEPEFEQAIKDMGLKKEDVVKNLKEDRKRGRR